MPFQVGKLVLCQEEQVDIGFFQSFTLYNRPIQDQGFNLKILSYSALNECKSLGLITGEEPFLASSFYLIIVSACGGKAKN